MHRSYKSTEMCPMIRRQTKHSWFRRYNSQNFVLGFVTRKKEKFKIKEEEEESEQTARKGDYKPTNAMLPACIGALWLFPLFSLFQFVNVYLKYIRTTTGKKSQSIKKQNNPKATTVNTWHGICFVPSLNNNRLMTYIVLVALAVSDRTSLTLDHSWALNSSIDAFFRTFLLSIEKKRMKSELMRAHAFTS